MSVFVETLESRRLFASVPAGFVDETVVTGLNAPTAMTLAPDGRIFVAQQGGDLRVVKNGALLDVPFLSLDVDSRGERGLLGVALDPAFDSNSFVYVYYTTTDPAIHNRVSRFTAAGDVVVPESEVVLLDLNNLTAAQNHNGGAIHFGVDDKLYIGVGENATPSNSQSLGNLLGKILRINSDGSIPDDNPYFNVATGQNRAIWAIGLRNPFTFAIQPGTGRMMINDVGNSTFEEINDGVAGGNYGWPATEGPTANPAFNSPIFFYGRDDGTAITGGTFYNPATAQFPSEFVGGYFFSDLTGGYIKRLDLANGNVAIPFATGVAVPLDLDVTADGSLLYLERATNRIGQIRVADDPPPTNQAPVPIIVAPRAGLLYRAGARYFYNGWATDPEDRVLRPTAFTWRVDFHHGDQVQNLIPDTTGRRFGSFFIPNVGNMSTDVFYRVTLSVTDSGSATTQVTRDIHPRIVTIGVFANVAGASFTLDGVPQGLLPGFTSVAGMPRMIGMLEPEDTDGVTFDFIRWADGPRRAERVILPLRNLNFRMFFRAVPENIF